MVEFGLGWQMAKWPLAGSGQAAEACKERQSANANAVRLILRVCRDGYFMTMGPQGTGNLERTYAFGNSNSKAKLLLSENRVSKQSSCTKWSNMSTGVHKESR